MRHTDVECVVMMLFLKWSVLNEEQFRFEPSLRLFMVSLPLVAPPSLHTWFFGLSSCFSTPLTLRCASTTSWWVVGPQYLRLTFWLRDISRRIILMRTPLAGLEGSQGLIFHLPHLHVDIPKSGVSRAARCEPPCRAIWRPALLTWRSRPELGAPFPFLV